MHPLEQLSAEEIFTASTAVLAYFKARGESQPRFNNVTLQEPIRQDILKFEQQGIQPQRRADVICCQHNSSSPIEVDVALLADGRAHVLSIKTCSGITSMVIDEMTEAEAAMKRDPPLLSLLKSHGIPIEHVVIDPWPIQAASGEVPVDRKWLAGFMYWQPTGDSRSNHYAHPLPWMPILDFATAKVVRIDNAHKGCPQLNRIPSDYHQALITEPLRTDLKPIGVTQPEGASFKVDGSLVQWQKWQFRIGFNYREGVVLHNVGYYCEESGFRPILHRMSLAEMCVPYGDPHPPFDKKLAFDAGDVGLGLATNSLSLGCDCIGTVHYLDGIVSNSKGEPVVIKNAVCLHEEDDGMSWKHTDIHTGHCEVRRGRRLVVQFIATLANYEYAFAWHFKTDASIEYNVKLTGILSTHISPPEESSPPEFASVVHPGVSAQYHQHLFCCRMDWACDDSTGQDNLVVSEVDIVPLRGARNVRGNAFVKKETDLLREGQAQRDVDASKARFWKVKNNSSINPVTGLPVAYKLVPANTQTLLGLPGSSTMTRAGFASKSLWVTEYDPKERWVGGKYPLQNPNPGGILEWVKQDRFISSPVMWHVFGTTHIPRPEDFPVMPVETIGFHLKPVGFFLKNPANDMPVSKDATSVLYQATQHQTEGHCRL